MPSRDQAGCALAAALSGHGVVPRNALFGWLGSVQPQSISRMPCTSFVAFEFICLLHVLKDPPKKSSDMNFGMCLARIHGFGLAWWCRFGVYCNSRLRGQHVYSRASWVARSRSLLNPQAIKRLGDKGARSCAQVLHRGSVQCQLGTQLAFTRPCGSWMHGSSL